uniref:Candidate secreted effector n=1 Tax=Meloidogyne incognita TaxID=6306 RepID=A0A914L1P5_MELIC
MKSEKQQQQSVPMTIQPSVLRQNNSLSSLLNSENHQQSNSLKNQTKNNGQNF